MITQVDEVEALCNSWRQALGEDLPAYRNHIYRVINLCDRLQTLDERAMRQVVIAACFHDVAIWLDDTFDYLSPSRHHARHYLASQGLDAWEAVVGPMIENHHKITPCRSGSLAETFRRADWIDVTLGVRRFGLPRGEFARIRKAFPNRGFHAFLLRRSARELLHRPWNPLPMMRW